MRGCLEAKVVITEKEFVCRTQIGKRSKVGGHLGTGGSGEAAQLRNWGKSSVVLIILFLLNAKGYGDRAVLRPLRSNRDPAEQPDEDISRILWTC